MSQTDGFCSAGGSLGQNSQTSAVHMRLRSSLQIFCLREESQTCVYLKSQMDMREIERQRDRERKQEVKTGGTPETGQKWEQKDKLEGERERDMWSLGEAPATVFQLVMMNYFDRDNQDDVSVSVPEDAVTARLSPPLGK